MTFAELLSRVKLLVLGDATFEEVSLSFQTDVSHERERIRLVVHGLDSKLVKQMIGDVLDVIAHVIRVHSDELDRQSVNQKLLLNRNSLADDFTDTLVRRTILQVLAEKQTGKIAMETLKIKIIKLKESQLTSSREINSLL